MTNGALFDMYALAFGALVCGTAGLIWTLKDKLRGRRSRIYDWAKDGECDNHSHPRIVA